MENGHASMDKSQARIAIALIIISAIIVAGAMIYAFIGGNPQPAKWPAPSIGAAPDPDWGSPIVLPEAPWDQLQPP